MRQAFLNFLSSPYKSLIQLIGTKNTFTRSITVFKSLAFVVLAFLSDGCGDSWSEDAGWDRLRLFTMKHIPSLPTGSVELIESNTTICVNCE